MTTRWTALPLVFLSFLSACSHNLYIVGRVNGVAGQTQITTTIGQHGGNFSISIAGKIYTGRWVYMANGGSVGFGTANVFSGGTSASASSSFLGLPTGGNGTLLATAADGSQLRCVFDYSTMSSTGVGTCEDNKGAFYDLQIN